MGCIASFSAKHHSYHTCASTLKTPPYPTPTHCAACAQALGLQQTARANLACFPYIVDWVGITRLVLQRAVDEVRRFPLITCAAVGSAHRGWCPGT